MMLALFYHLIRIWESGELTRNGSSILGRVQIAVNT